MGIAPVSGGKLSVVIPAHNEQGSLKSTILAIERTLVLERIEHEILVINDHSSDATEEILKNLQRI